MATHGRIRSTRLLVVSLVLASLATITLDSRGGDSGPLASVSRILGGVVGALQEGVSAVFRPVGSFVTNVFQAGSLAERVDQLEIENSELQARLQESATLVAENEELAGILGLAEELNRKVMGASVIGESSSDFEWAVNIDKGADDGVVEDMPVIAAAGLVGRVVSVYDTTSKIMLIIDPDSKVSARLSSSRDTGLLEGQREELLRFNLIGTETEIVPSELVETSGYQLDEGYTGLFPPGIPIGVVDSREASDDGVTVRVLVRPNVNFSRLEKVGLITDVTDLSEEIAA
ncbi:MAG: rod shape-determining protein MreC [Actinomycetota bacterium]